MKSAFRKLSRVGSLTGGTTWYLSEDCLLAAKRMMYVVEYRRFYLRDLESIVVWPSGAWPLRLMLPAGVLAVIGALFWHADNSLWGSIVGGLSLGWVGLELLLGPTAKSRVSITGGTVDLPLVKRTRRAGKVLARIDAAVRATRAVVEHPATSTVVNQPAESPVRAGSEASASASGTLASQTNVF